MNAQANDPRIPGGKARSNGNGNGAAHAAFDAHALRDQPVGSLLRELGHEVSALVTDEMALAKLEAREALTTAQRAAAATASGGAVATAGLVILLLSAVYGLSLVLAPWLAALLVGGVALIVGLAMVSAARQRFDAQHLKPQRTIDSLRQDKDALRGRTP